jgi:DsbC/DsbD-like thiol-disulfide interchange protein
MVTMMDHLRPAAAACVIVLAAFQSGAAVAADASPWDGDARSAVRLIAGSRIAGPGNVRAGVEIKLKPGWHTYWRYPGDAGVPPRFDFGGSQNLKSIDVRWPAPRRLPEESLTTIGYDRDVIIPLAIVPQDPAKPVLLQLKLDYAVCEKLCVPAEAKAEIVIAVGPSAQDASLVAAEARVPKKLALGAGSGLSIRSIRRDNGAAKPRVIVDVASPNGAAVDLFAEGPTAYWAFPVPVATGTVDGLQRFAFELDGAPPGAKYQGTPVTLTATAGNDAIEVTTHLD